MTRNMLHGIYAAIIAVAGAGVGERHFAMRAANLAKEGFKDQVAAVTNHPAYLAIKDCRDTAHGVCLDDFFHDMEDEISKAQGRAWELERRIEDFKDETFRAREAVGEAWAMAENKVEALESCRSELWAIKDANLETP